VCQLQAAPGTATRAVLDSLTLTWSGVDLFFVLSGLLIGGILIDNRERPSYFRSFYARRFCRIFPLYYAFLALYFVAARLPSATAGPRWSWLLEDPLPFWSYATFLQNYAMAAAGRFGAQFAAVTWSLAIEEQFYLLLPLFVRLIPPRRLGWALGALIASAVGLRAIVHAASGGSWVVNYVLLPSRMDTLLLGVGLAVLVRSPAIEWLAPRRRWLTVLLVAEGLLLLPLRTIPVEALALWGYTALAAFYATLVLRVRLGAGEWWGAVFRSRPLVYLGTVSYGLYLVHQVASGALHGAFFGRPPRITTLAEGAVTLLALALTLLVCELSWRFFERPIVEWGRRFRY
jgi:peptidoglycan/LPS O-acetylase OafA/YrhL